MADEIVLVDQIEPLIVTIRDHNVLLDQDLAALYGVPTKRLNEQVRRNRERFPGDFMFQLTDDEIELMRSQNATASKRNIRYRPYAFTEHGAIMAANVLNSPRAVQVNIAIMRAFVRLREILSSHKDLARKLEEMEKKYDAQFKVVFDAIRELMKPPSAPPKRKIGFVAD